MAPDVENDIVTLCFGLLIVGFGSIWAFNLFGVTTEHARRIRAVRLKKALGARLSHEHTVRIGRMTGVGIIVFGVALLTAGVANLVGDLT